ncbi:SGNH/GDSL hydrolase family protein [Rosistilla oblonga]|uniref:SGNH/GDSL hydrolase family protein n=1 Tax=Rosistilla oblonga TaxID=2527990 RepID=UPI003A9731C5
MMKLTRRNLLQSTIVAGVAASSVTTATTVSAANDSNVQSLPEGAVILFQGDSITDARRDRKKQTANQSAGLGDGYPFLIAGGLLESHPAKRLQIHNRGISGNKVPDLAKRWQADCLDLKPNILSILVGVNDIWHKLNGRYDGSVDVYESGYRELIEGTLSALPDVRVVVCEPFVLRCGAVNDKWFPEFDQRREAALRVAESMSLTVVPFQQMFDKAIDEAPPAYWAADGVHPTLAGHTLMAKTWRETVGV